VLVAHRKERLEELPAELRAQHRIQVHVTELDLATDEPGRRRDQTRLTRRRRHTALAALNRMNPPPSVVAGRMNRVMAFLARRPATRRQIIRTTGRPTAEGA
jgi:hypothetical protein